MCLCANLSTLSAAGEVSLTVNAADYLKLLEGGNFIHFVAMVNADNDVSAVETHNLRLKVRPVVWGVSYYACPPLRPLTYPSPSLRKA